MPHFLQLRKQRRSLLAKVIDSIRESARPLCPVVPHKVIHVPVLHQIIHKLLNRTHLLVSKGRVALGGEHHLVALVPVPVVLQMREGIKRPLHEELVLLLVFLSLGIVRWRLILPHRLVTQWPHPLSPVQVHETLPRLSQVVQGLSGPGQPVPVLHHINLRPRPRKDLLEIPPQQIHLSTQIIELIGRTVRVHLIVSQVRQHPRKHLTEGLFDRPIIQLPHLPVSQPKPLLNGTQACKKLNDPVVTGFHIFNTLKI